MDAELFQKFHPEEYYRRFLTGGVRPDGRSLHDRRKVQLQRRTFTSADGSASGRLGRSKFAAGVRAEVATAVPEVPAIGKIVVSVEFPALCSASFRDNRKASSLGTTLSKSLNDVLNDPAVFDVDQLQIREQEAYWILYVDILCLNFDGNAFDLCLLTAVAALEDTVLPALTFDVAAERYQAAGSAETDLAAAARSLVLLVRPLPVTFAQLLSEKWVVDPSAEEEALGSVVSLCLLGESWAVYHEGGGRVVTENFLAELMPAARGLAHDLAAFLDETQQFGMAPAPQGGTTANGVMAE